ncbi:MAG TPA: maleylpyruvate isomerase family mycothiol-dependent enzyme, partial [Lapillicoccus sp.]
MPLTQQECAAAIADHSRGFADAATGNLDAEVEFCPGWTVRDVVHHLTRVQWFWATLVEDRHAERPDDLEEPEPAGDETALAVFRSGAERLVRVLGEADPAIRVWTWAPSQQTAAFVIRHQVQEAVGHHWDVAHAAGGTVRIDPAVGADAVDE